MSTTPEIIEDIEAIEDEKFALEYARAVRWAAQNMHRPARGKGCMNREKAGSDLRFGLWKFAKDNDKQFMVNLVREAVAFLDKRQKSAVDESELAKAEQTDIDDMKEYLRGALEHSKCVTP